MSIKHFFSILIISVVFLHVATFYAPHNEGDEMAYLGLSHAMGWDFSNYSTKNINPVNSFPNKLYRADIFLHPPLFPLLLKFGWILKSPVIFGLLINLFLHFGIVYLCFKISKSLGLTDIYCQLCALYGAFCPIIGFISTRLLTDALFTSAFLLTALHLILSINKKSAKHLFYSAIGFSLVLASKFQGVFYIPAYSFLYAYIYFKFVVPNNKSLTDSYMLVLLSVLAVFFIGASHYLIVLLNYGVDGIKDLIYTIEYPVGPFVQRMGNRSLLKMLAYLLLLQPWIMLFAFFMIFYHKNGKALLAKNDFIVLAFLAIYTFFVISFTTFNQERYWSPLTPLIFILLMSIFSFSKFSDFSTKLAKSILFFCIGLLVLNTFVTNVVTPGAITAIVRPTLMFLLPFLDAPGGVFYGF